MSKKIVSGVRVEGPVSVTRAVRLPDGWACAAVSGDRLLAVEWERDRAGLSRVLERKYPGAAKLDLAESGAGIFLGRYARGVVIDPPAPSDVTIDWDRVRGFDRAVLAETMNVPYGRTISYGELARRAGRPGAARAAGAALGRNPWPVLVPCHRVVGIRGDLVGFGKGLAAKEALIRFEASNARMPMKQAIRSARSRVVAK